MKSHRLLKGAVFIAIVLAILFVVFSKKHIHNVPVVRTPYDHDSCKRVQTFEQGHSYLSQIRPSDNFLKSRLVVAAAPPDGAQEEAISATYTEDQIFLWIPKTEDRLMVNHKYFSDLHIVDATQLKKDERAFIGTATKATRMWLTPPELLSFLLETEIIGTYAHMRSDVCHRAEEIVGDVFRTDIDAMHTYFTNEKNEDEYTFAVELNSKTGEMWVIGT